MPKPIPQRGPDPMAGVVDRLLAQLPGLQGHAEPPRPTPGRTAVYSGSATTFSTPPVSSQAQLIAVWIRLLLGLSLGVMMGWWPYARDCGLPLISYLGAVSTVVLAGTWAATASWRARSGLAHAIALSLALYGLLLAESELLRRTGYAVERATWTCQDLAAGPAIVLSDRSLR